MKNLPPSCLPDAVDLLTTVKNRFSCEARDLAKPGFSFLLLSALILSACQPDLPRDVTRAYKNLPAEIDFNFDVRPVLSDRCFACHGPDAHAREADLRLDTEEGAKHTLLEEGGYAVIEGDIEQSGLVQRILDPNPEMMMPPAESNLSLDAREKAILIKWIEQGAEWKNHWAFSAPERPEVPARRWGANEIDAFVLARLEQEGVSPSPRAEKETLLRRVTLDLTGLPPSLEELDAFLADDSEEAYENAVDRLIASTAYGERWAWEWLDASRYADTNGFQGDPTRTMWPWRDWVIEALNANMPYDAFTIEQLAGDLLPDASTEQILATAFNRNHMYNGEGGRIPEETRVENVFDRVETVGTIWMGLTMNCSRCHDHKYDPLTQREYYQMFDYFNQTSEEGGQAHGRIEPTLNLSPADNQEKIATRKAELQRVADELHAYEKTIFPRAEGLPASESPNARGIIGENVDALKMHPSKRSNYYVGRLKETFDETNPTYGAKLQALRVALAAYNREAAKNVLVMVMDEREEPRETFVLTRGTYDKPEGDPLTRNTPAFLPAVAETGTNNRLTLAEWLMDPGHPLTARVTVNRIWQTFFGMGLVKTSEDFGVQGEKPSHPRLLDWLAVDFQESGWDVKALHKKIVMSETYQQSSRVSPELLETDPENRLMARGPRYRLPSWMIRDQALAVSGLLVDKQGGPSVKPYQPVGIWKDATFGKIAYDQGEGEDLYRRTLYTFWRRIVGPTMLFDTAARQTCTVRSSRTNTPLHALITLNDVTYAEAARAMAERVMVTHEEDQARIVLAFRLATARYPNDTEREILTERLDILRGQYIEDPQSALDLLAVGESPHNESLDPIEHAAFTGISSLILNLDETLSKQ